MAEIAKAKFEMKYDAQYKDVGKIIPPGVVVEENKRRKILKELGVELRTTVETKKEEATKEETKDGVEEKSKTSIFSKQQAEKEKTKSLSMIPDKYRMQAAPE